MQNERGRNNLCARILDLESELKGLDGQPESDPKTREIQDSLIALRRKINALAYISQLPDDLLTMIFMECRLLLPPINFTEMRDEDCAHNAVLFLTHTCHRWREIALAYSNLWTLIRYPHPEFVECCLKRSRKLPLSMEIDTTPSEHTRFHQDDLKKDLHMIFENLERVQELSIITYVEWARHACKTYRVELLTPILESINVEVKKIRKKGIPSFSLTEHLLRSNPPKLKRLSTLDMAFRWWRWRFPSQLTHLAIRMTETRHLIHTHFTMDDVIICLQKLSSLQDLELDFALPLLPIPDGPLSVDVSAGEASVTLPQLQRLALTSDIICCVYLLNRLTLPSTAAVYLNVCTMEWQEDLPLVMPSLTRRLLGEHVIRPSPLLSLAIIPERGLEDNVAIYAYTSVPPLETVRNEELQDFDICIGPTRDFIPVMSAVCTQMRPALTNVQLFSLAHLGPMPTGTFINNFGHMNDLRTLDLSGASANVLPDLLTSSRQIGGKAGTNESDHCFPRLEKVTIWFYSFKGKNHGGLAQDIMWKELSAALKYRKERNMAIRELVFDACDNITEADAKTLSRFVGTILHIQKEDPEDDIADNHLGTWEHPKDPY
ncbi:unnamed protein product [Somion occarium]|uniref:F-box domain-containing protein n=1 Tax=Somion occarium TaxID=3059160 RepID=A0ABP1D2I1_9APHY